MREMGTLRRPRRSIQQVDERDAPGPGGADLMRRVDTGATLMHQTDETGTFGAEVVELRHHVDSRTGWRHWMVPE
jgi:hypothetical protein